MSVGLVQIWSCCTLVNFPVPGRKVQVPLQHALGPAGYLVRPSRQTQTHINIDSLRRENIIRFDFDRRNLGIAWGTGKRFERREKKTFRVRSGHLQPNPLSNTPMYVL